MRMPFFSMQTWIRWQTFWPMRSGSMRPTRESWAAPCQRCIPEQAELTLKRVTTRRGLAPITRPAETGLGWVGRSREGAVACASSRFPWSSHSVAQATWAPSHHRDLIGGSIPRPRMAKPPRPQVPTRSVSWPALCRATFGPHPLTSLPSAAARSRGGRTNAPDATPPSILSLGGSWRSRGVALSRRYRRGDVRTNGRGAVSAVTDGKGKK